MQFHLNNFHVRSVIVILILISLFLSVQSATLDQDEYNFMVSIRTLFHLESNFPTEPYNFCSGYPVVECSTNLDIKSIFMLNLDGQGTAIIPDFSSLSKLNNLSIRNAVETTSIFTLLPVNITTLTCIKCGINTIPQTLPQQFNSLTLVNNPITSTLYLNMGPNILSVYNNDLAFGYIPFINNLNVSSNPTINTFQFMTDSYINFTNIHINTLTLYLFEPDAQFPLQSIVDTFGLVGSFKIISSTLTPQFPNPILPNSKYLKIGFENINLLPPTNGLPMNLSSFSSLSLLEINNAPNYNLNGLIPFTNFPKTLIQITMNGASITSLGNFFIDYPSTTYVIFKHNLLTEFPIIPNNINYTLYIDISNNNIAGPLDPVAICQNYIIVANNSITGELPQCIGCYLNYPLIYEQFMGNQFSNYQDGSTNYPECKINITSFSNITTGTSLIVSGYNVPQYNALIVSDPPLKWSVETIGEITRISATLGASYNIVKQRGNVSITFLATNNITVTIPIYLLAPQIISIFPIPLSNGYIFSFVGLSFAGVNRTIKIGDYNCVIEPSNSGVYSLDCMIYSTNIPEGLYMVNFTVDKLSTIYPYQFARKSPVVSSVSPCSKYGGNVILFGNFGFNFTNPIVIIGDDICHITSIYTANISCTLPQGEGIKDIFVSVNNENVTMLQYYVYKESSKQCPGGCSGNGVCSLTGFCTCYSGFGGGKCQYVVGSNGVLVNVSTTLTQEDVNFEISIRSIKELSYKGGLVKEHILSGWKLTDQPDRNTWVYSVTLENNTTIVSYSIFRAPSNMNVTFIGIPIYLAKDSIKISINISNWQYQSFLNYLQLTIGSNVSSESSCDANINSFEDEINSLNYFQIEKDGKVLYGKFIDQMLSDGKLTYSATKLLSKSDNELVVGISMPQCKECLLDPDFSVLVNTRSECDSKPDPKWIIPTAVILSVAVFVSIVIIAIFLLRKGNHIIFTKTRVIVFNRTIKLRNQSKKSMTDV